MNDGKILALFLVLCAAVCVSVCFTDCATTGLQRNTGDVIAANARAAGRLEATVSSLDDIVSDSRERLAIVSRASQRIAGGIDRVEYLFGEYEQETLRLLDEIDSLRSQIEAEGKDNSKPDGDTAGTHSD